MQPLDIACGKAAAMLGIRCSLGDKVERWSCIAGHCRRHSPAASNYTRLQASALTMEASIVVLSQFFYNWRYCNFYPRTGAERSSDSVGRIGSTEVQQQKTMVKGQVRIILFFPRPSREDLQPAFAVLLVELLFITRKQTELKTNKMTQTT